MDRLHLLGDQGPDLRQEVRRIARLGPPAEGRDRLGGQQQRFMTSGRALGVVAARLVGNTAPGPRVQPRLAPRRPVDQRATAGRPGEGAAPAGRQQGHVIEEVEPEAAQQHRFTGRDGREVEVRGVGGREVAQARTAGGVVGQMGGGLTAYHREMPLGEDHRGQSAEHRPVVQDEGLARCGLTVRCVPVVLQAYGAGPVDQDRHGGGGVVHGRAERPPQIAPVAGTRRIVVGPEPLVGVGRGPLVQARPRAYRSLAADAVVGEHGDL